MERKVRYDASFKLECVKLVLEKHYSCNYVSKQKGLNESNIRKWVRFYKQYGSIGLLPRKNQSYSVAFKLKVLKAIDNNSLSLRAASVKFNIPDTSIIVKWKKDFTTFGLVGLQPKTRGRPTFMDTNKRKKRKSDKPLTREEELLLENEALRCENELLKKLQALIQAEEKARKRKP
ncbi:Helix-turn-helix domain-containing protein [Flavobacterium sp. 9R]|jgi:transposase|uniref:helix-turn-helix domain-containing protein n=3 Tax=Flavobacterium sp. 9R TaxID=2653143 RepID=UPI0012F3F6D6|nr:helix-turn-helix domain-containing protein [Flavobacterium sp. 9R]VXB42975.1 Helix-turn-helix domain-containing protein [Flavobacterium sp. 9R]